MGYGKIKWVIAAWFVSAGLSSAATITDLWLGGTGTWSASADWSAGSPNNVGSTTYAVTVASGGSDQVTFDTSFMIDSLAIGGSNGSSLLQSGLGSLTLQVGGALTVGQTGVLSLSNGDTMTVGSAMNAGNIGVSSNASLGVTGDLTNALASNSSGLVVGGGNLTVGGTMYNQSTLEVGASGAANINALNNTGVVTIDSGGVLNLTGGGLGLTDIAAGASYSVSGAFNVTNGGTSSYALANLATVEGGLLLQNGQTTTLSSLNNSGGLSLVGPGTVLTVTGDLTNTLVNRFSALVVGGGGTLNASGTLYNQSTLDVAGEGTANINALNNTGTVAIEGGAALNLTGGGTGVTDIAAGTSYSVSGAFNVINGGTSSDALANLATVEGSLQLSNGQTTTLSSLNNSGGLSVGGPGTVLTVTGDLTNTLVNRFSALVVGGGGTLNVGGTMYNYSTLDVAGAGTANINTLINEYPTGVVTIEAGGDACIGSLSNGGLLNIDGTLNSAGCAQTDTTLTEIIASADSFGVFDYSGPVTLGGTLDIELQNGFIPTVGESFDFIQFPAGDLTGTFDDVTNRLFNGNTEEWVLTYDNADGDVLLTAAEAQASAAPEPSTMLLLGVSLIALGAWRSRGGSRR